MYSECILRFFCIFLGVYVLSGGILTTIGTCYPVLLFLHATPMAYLPSPQINGHQAGALTFYEQVHVLGEAQTASDLGPGAPIRGSPILCLH